MKSERLKSMQELTSRLNPLRYRLDVDVRTVLDVNASYFTGLKWEVRVAIRDTRPTATPTERLAQREIGGKL